MEQRIRNLVSLFPERQVDCLIVSHPLNVHYLFGVGVHEALDIIGVVSERGWRIVTDSRYWEHVRQMGHADMVQVTPTQPRAEAVAVAVRELGGARAGFEAASVTVATLKEWGKAARKSQIKLKPTLRWVEDQRAVKDEPELSIIRQAVQLADDCFEYLCGALKPGLTEKEVAWMIESFLRTHGADGLAFDPIVASGPNAALPHALPTDRQIATGEPITLDYGARVRGYVSDLTRTVCLGHLPDQFKKVHQVVLAAVKAAEKRIRPGVSGKRADAYARRVIEKAGWGEYFGHGTGHGVGLETHEAPRATRVSREHLAPGMTLTVEPGIYLPGWGGVRVEDLGVVTESGFQVLTRASKDPLIRV